MKSFQDRLKILERKLYYCGFCNVTEEQTLLIASCLQPTKFVCEACIHKADNILNSQFCKSSPTISIFEKATICDFCSIREPRTIIRGNKVQICASCNSKCLEICAKFNPTTISAASKTIEERILTMEKRFAAKLKRPENGFLFERNDQWPSWWSRVNGIKRHRSAQRDLFSLSELQQCLESLERLTDN